MNLHSVILDDFLADFDRWRAWMDKAAYADVTSPVDGVVYPGICSTLPADLGREIAQNIETFIGKMTINHLFARLSLANSRPPHWAHHDGSMGAYSLMIYMNRPEHCEGGTALLRHRYGDVSQEEWARDTNRHDQWHLLSVCEMQPNRAFLFRADQMHAALPVGGFGTTAQNGRLVITAFIG